MERFSATPRPKPRQRYAFAAAVLAFHAVLVAGFLLYDTLPLPSREPQPLEVTFLLKPLAPAKPPPEPKFPTLVKKREQEKSNAITLPETAETLGSLGRYLACQSNYENLSPEEQLHCAQARWTPPDVTESLMLGLQLPTVWADALAKRNAPFVPMLRPCRLDEVGPNAEARRLGFYCH